jgi:hypothetical protein
MGRSDWCFQRRWLLLSVCVLMGASVHLFYDYVFIAAEKFKMRS